MNQFFAKLFNFLKREEVQASMGLVSSTTSVIGNVTGELSSTIVSEAVDAFKDASVLADTIMLNSILKGLASGLNQEKYINELETYVNSNPENAGRVASTLRKALLAESPMACTLLGRMLADHIREKTAYDRYDVIIVHALEIATDTDLIAFRTMMNAYDGKTITITDLDTVDWCLTNRIFKQNVGMVESGAYIMAPRLEPTEAGKKLLGYIEETKSLFRDSLL